MLLEWMDEREGAQAAEESDGQTQALLTRVMEEVLRREGEDGNVVVGVTLVDGERIRELNRAFRSVDRVTDVLSFPTVNYPAGKTAGACEALLREEFDPDTDACAIGDIVISMDHVRAQAAEYGHSERRECGYLLTHGLFHLMGYDHMTDEDKPVMRAMEEKALASIGLTREE